MDPALHRPGELSEPAGGTGRSDLVLARGRADTVLCEDRAITTGAARPEISTSARMSTGVLAWELIRQAERVTASTLTGAIRQAQPIAA